MPLSGQTTNVSSREFWEIISAVYTCSNTWRQSYTHFDFHTQHMSYCYDMFTSVSVGAYTLEEALMEHLAGKGSVRSILRVCKSLEVRLKSSGNTANFFLKLDSLL